MSVRCLCEIVAAIRRHARQNPFENRTLFHRFQYGLKHPLSHGWSSNFFETTHSFFVFFCCLKRSDELTRKKKWNKKVKHGVNLQSRVKKKRKNNFVYLFEAFFFICFHFCLLKLKIFYFFFFFFFFLFFDFFLIFSFR